MQYEQYYRRIFKLKKIRDVLHHYRMLIFAITGIAVTISSTMFSIKGLVNGEVFFDNMITYGESYRPSGTAIFEDVTYEYAAVDSDQWDEIAPIQVGNYQVRGKARNNFNDFYYGKTHFFSIVPKTVSINFLDSSIVYGTKPRISMSLIYQDQISDFTTIVEDYSTRNTNIEVDLATLKIIDTRGEDVTFCYDFIQEPAAITLLPRPVEFSFKGSEKIYDGTPLSNETYDLKGELAVGDRFELDPSLQQTDIGSTLNRRQVRMLNQADLDVTHLYDISIESESLMVNKRPLTLRSNAMSKMYDGIKFSEELFVQEIVSGTLLAGHRMETTFLQATRFIVGADVNAFTVNIFSDDGEIVNELYDLDLEFGNFSITKRPLTVETNSAQKVYDGTILENRGYTITAGELSSYDRIESVCDSSILAFGEIPNACSFTILHESDEDVTSSYDLNAIPGQLLIDQRPLTIQLPSRQKVYDGTALEVDDFIVDETQLAEEHTIRLDQWTSVINAGTYDHDFQWTILDSQGIPVTSNYQLQVLGIEDAVTISRRPLSLLTKSLTRTYNATPLEVFSAASNADRFDIVNGDLAVGHSIRVLSSSSLTNVGSIPNVIEVVIENALNNNVTSNYDLNIEAGTLTVNTFQSITITSTNQTKIYNDQPFTSATNYSLSRNLFGTDRISIMRITSTQVDVGSSPMVIDPTSIVIRNSQGENTTNNYDLIIVANTGQLTVTKRPLTVRISTQQKTYDGQPLVSNQQAQVITPTTIVPGHSLQVSSGVTPPVSVTDYDNGNTTPTNSVVKVFRANVDVTSNYNLNVEEGSLRINQRIISVQTNGGTKVYDGTPLTSFTPTASLRTGTLVAGHQLVPTFDKQGYQPTNVFDIHGRGYSNSATFRIIDTFNQNRDVTFNYSFQQPMFGTVEITKRPITLSVIPLRLEYNGALQGYNTPKSTISPRTTGDLNPVYLATGTPLPEGFRLETGLNLQATDAGEYLNNFQLVDLAFYNSANQLIDERNFEITKNLGLIIQRRPITISSLSGSKAEDGESFPKTKQISQGELAPGHTIVYPDTPDMILARPEPYINEIYPPIIYDALGRDVTLNYQITYQPGEVVIFSK
jgi:hypothetical protein